MTTVVLNVSSKKFTKVVKDENDVISLMAFIRHFLDVASLEDKIVSISLVGKDDFVESFRENQTS